MILTQFPNGFGALRFFDINPVPKWIWGEDNWQLSRQLIVPYGLVEPEKGRESSPSPPSPTLCHRLLIQYRYEGREVATLRLRLLIGDRDFHHQQIASPELRFSQVLLPQQICLQAIKGRHFGTPWHLRWTQAQQICLQAINGRHFGTPWHLRWTQGDYRPDGLWYWHYRLPEETQRGLGDREDLYSPGYLSVTLKPGDVVTLEARVGFPNPQPDPLSCETFAEAIEAEEERLSQIFGWDRTRTQRDKEDREENSSLSPSPIWQQLLKASDQFVVYRASIAGPTVIAGYHWFNDWGRDTLIALPGLALVPQAIL